MCLVDGTERALANLVKHLVLFTDIGAILEKRLDLGLGQLDLHRFFVSYTDSTLLPLLPGCPCCSRRTTRLCLPFACTLFFFTTTVFLEHPVRLCSTAMRKDTSTQTQTHNPHATLGPKPRGKVTDGQGARQKVQTLLRAQNLKMHGRAFAMGPDSVALLPYKEEEEEELHGMDGLGEGGGRGSFRCFFKMFHLLNPANRRCKIDQALNPCNIFLKNKNKKIENTERYHGLRRLLTITRLNKERTIVKLRWRCLRLFDGREQGVLEALLGHGEIACALVLGELRQDIVEQRSLDPVDQAGLGHVGVSVLDKREIAQHDTPVQKITIRRLKERT